jgi:hypothetical protein
LQILSIVGTTPGTGNLVVHLKANALARVAAAHLAPTVLQNLSSQRSADLAVAFGQLGLQPDQLVSVGATLDGAPNHEVGVEVAPTPLNLRMIGPAHALGNLVLR